jgi:hypothetical protein
MAEPETKVQIINPPNTLRAMVDDGKASKGIDPTLLAKAEKALDDAKPQIEAHVKGEVIRLQAVMAKVLSSQAADKSVMDELFHVAFELKGQGTSAGFSLVTRFADSLCRYTEAMKQPGAKELAIMKAHVDSISAIVSRSIHGDQNPVGLAIAAELEKVVGRPT